MKHTGVYSDNDVAGQDFWADDLPKYARGAYFEVYKNSVHVWDGFLGDGLGAGDPGIGCTPTMTVASANGTYELTVSSYGWGINGNDVEVYDDSGYLRAASDDYTVAAGSGTYTPTISVSAGLGYDVLNVYQLGAYALYRHNGGNSGQLFEFNVGDSHSGGSYNGTQVNLSRTASDQMFLVVHEDGHRMADLRTQSVMNDAQDYSINDATCPGEPTGTPHSMRSKEYSGAAAGEGFSHFYAADVFNSHDEADCAFAYYKNTAGISAPLYVDCESANTNFPVNRLDTDCGGGAGRGTELDWLRQYWDVHTNGATPPTFTAMCDWLDTATAWTRSSAYQQLDAEANDVGGALNTNWDGAKAVNGVDH